MLRLGGNVAGKRVREPAFRDTCERSCCRRRHEAVEQKRNPPHASSQGSTEHGRKLAPADQSERGKRIGKSSTMPRKRAVDHLRLSRQPCIVDAGTAAHPVAACAAKKGGGDGGSHSSIGDPHLAQADKVKIVRDGIDARTYRSEELVFVHG